MRRTYVVQEREEIRREKNEIRAQKQKLNQANLSQVTYSDMVQLMAPDPHTRARTRGRNP